MGGVSNRKVKRSGNWQPAAFSGETAPRLRGFFLDLDCCAESNPALEGGGVDRVDAFHGVYASFWQRFELADAD